MSPHSNGAAPTIRILAPGESPSAGFVRRPRPVSPAIIRHASWWKIQEHELTRDPGKVWLWLPSEDVAAYERNSNLTRKKRGLNRSSLAPSKMKLTNGQ